MSAEAINRLLATITSPRDAMWAQVDWQAVQERLGTALPFDFKAFVDQAPAGTFSNELLPNYPGLLGYPANDYLAPHAHILNTFVRWRHSGDGNFPFPLYPEPQGVLLWASGNSSCYWWLTGPKDPNEWKVVTCDRSFNHWRTHEAGMAQFVVAELDAGRLARFKPYPAAKPRPFEPAKANEQTFYGLPLPRDDSEALIGAIGSPAPASRRIDWAALETRLGTALPSDYKAFMDGCGTGCVCDITILGPDPCESHNLVASQAGQAAAAENAGLAEHVSFHPSRHGLLCWGRRADGTYLSWKTVKNDPQHWTVVAFLPHMRSQQSFDDMSFSTFLLRYSGVLTPMAVIIGEPWQAGITFSPHNCS